MREHKKSDDEDYGEENIDEIAPLAQDKLLFEGKSLLPPRRSQVVSKRQSRVSGLFEVPA